MKRAALSSLALSSSVVAVCLAVSYLAFSQSNAKPAKQAARRPACDFNITGLWRTDATSQSNPVYYDFSPEGWVVLLGFAQGALPQEFETITSVGYKLDKPSRPKAIEFMTTRGNDVFGQGMSLLKVLELGEDSFTTRNVATGEETRWTRELTHRYFLTFVARSGAPRVGGPAFVMWTAMDGRETRVDALGVLITKDAEGRPVPVFGPIPPEIYEQTREPGADEKKGKPEEIVTMRLELTGSDFQKNHKVFEEWDKSITNRTLPPEGPYPNAMEIIKKAADSLGPCGENIKLQKLDRTTADEINSKYSPPERPFEYIRLMRKKNYELHVPDKLFPWNWRPTIQVP